MVHSFAASLFASSNKEFYISMIVFISVCILGYWCRATASSRVRPVRPGLRMFTRSFQYERPVSAGVSCPRNSHAPGRQNRMVDETLRKSGRGRLAGCYPEFSPDILPRRGVGDCRARLTVGPFHDDVAADDGPDRPAGHVPAFVNRPRRDRVQKLFRDCGAAVQIDDHQIRPVASCSQA